MKLKKPNRNPDWCWQNKKYYAFFFEEMIYDWQGIEPEILRLKFVNNELKAFRENSQEFELVSQFRKDITEAYKEWQFNKAIKELLCES